MYGIKYISAIEAAKQHRQSPRATHDIIQGIGFALQGRCLAVFLQEVFHEKKNHHNRARIRKRRS